MTGEVDETVAQPLTHRSLADIVSKVASVPVVPEEPWEFMLRLAAGLRDAANGQPRQAIRYEQVVNDRGGVLYVHTCGQPRFRRVTAEIVSGVACVECRQSTAPDTWQPVYRKVVTGDGVDS